MLSVILCRTASDPGAADDPRPRKRSREKLWNGGDCGLDNEMYLDNENGVDGGIGRTK